MRIRRKPWLHLFLLALLGWVAYSWLTGPSGIINQIQLHRQNKELAEAIDSLKAVKMSLDKERVRLRTDTLYLEKISRLISPA